MEVATLRGTVVGDAGAPVAGWVSLGPNKPQRWVGRTFELETTEGHRVEVIGLEPHTVEPVERKKAEWQAVENDDVVKMFLDQAPAPDVKVTLTSAVLRGGEEIVVWGGIFERGYVGGNGDAQSASYREAPAAGITKLKAYAIGRGDDRDDALEEARLRYLDKERDDIAAARKVKETHEAKQTSASKSAAKAASKAAAKAKGNPDLTDRLGIHWMLGISVLALLAVAGVGVATSNLTPTLLSCAVVACVPLAFDAVTLPRFRTGAMRPASLEIPFIVFLIAGACTVMFAFGSAIETDDPDKARGTQIVAYLGAAVTLVFALVLWFATRGRRRRIAILASAPPHAEPLADRAWGASDGTFEKEVLAIGETFKVWGNATKDAAGNKHRNVSTEPFSRLTYEATLYTKPDRAQRPIRLAEAEILTLVKLDRSTGTDRGERADVITATTPVRVAGRARAGVLSKAGEASLLVFASGIGTDVAVEVKRFHRRELVDQALAIAAVGCYVAAFLV